MRLLEAGPMRVKHPTQKRTVILVPGGWPIRVPEIERVRDANVELSQLMLDSAYVKALREAIARRAKEYAKLHPELCEPTGPETSRGRFVHLLGFDPEELQSTFTPFHGVGREAHDALVEILQEMGEKEKERRKAKEAA